MCKKYLSFDYCFDDSYCKTCRGFCCKGEGFVFISEEDIKAISNFLQLKEKDFLEKYTSAFYNKIILKSLKINNEFVCCFLNKEGSCEIYPSRPLQCRTFPFWDSMRNLSLEELNELCPAIKKHND